MQILGDNKFLEYSLDGKVISEKQLNYKKYTFHPLSPNEPRIIMYDSLLVLYPSQHIIIDNKSLNEEVQKQLKESFLLQLYSIQSQQVVATHFPMDEISDLKLFNQLYQYNDSLYFYYDKEQFIYLISPTGKKEKYRIDKGKYNKLQKLEEYNEARINGIEDTKRIIMQSCNETDQYVIGKYLFKNIFYTFIYDKQKKETKNYKIINNDLLGLTGKENKVLFDYKTAFQFKDNYLWLTIDRNFLDLMEKIKSNMTAKEWENFEIQHSDFTRIYHEFKEKGDALEEETPILLIRYYFK